MHHRRWQIHICPDLLACGTRELHNLDLLPDGVSAALMHYSEDAILGQFWISNMLGAPKP